MILFRNKISYYFPHPLIVMKQLYFLIVWLITSGIYVFSVSAYGIDDNRLPTLSTDIISANKDPINILTLVQVVLLKVLLPVVVMPPGLRVNVHVWALHRWRWWDKAKESMEISCLYGDSSHCYCPIVCYCEYYFWT